MRINHLELYRFRNLNTQRVSPPSRVSIFVGKNGTGKTTLLEAVYLLAFGRSFRTPTVKDLITWREDNSKNNPIRVRVGGEFEGEAGTFQIAVQLGGEKREIILNDKRINAASDFYGRVKVVEFSPDDLLLVKDAPSVRRQFLDRAISMVDAHYVTLLVYYQRALKNRNAILHQRGRGTALADEVASWSVPLVQYGLQIAKTRAHFLTGIGPLLKKYYLHLATKSGEEAALSYKSHFLAGDTTVSERELLALYQKNLTDDVRYRTTTVGVHRDDLILSLDAGFGLRPARRFASQGQMRSIVLAVKFATLEYVAQQTGEWPILLLDDVESELDVTRKEALAEFIRTTKSQVMVTTTDATQFQSDLGSDLCLFTIEGGAVKLRGES